jgi:hypothetical protein
MAESTNKTVVALVKAALGGRWLDWRAFVPEIEWCINTHHNRSINMSPYEAFYGRPPRTALRRAAGIPSPSFETLGDLHNLIAYVHDRVHIAASVSALHQKGAHDAAHAPPDVKVGDNYLLYTPNSAGNKLVSDLHGPYKVVSVSPDGNFADLEDWVNGKLDVQRRVHVSRLHPFDASRHTARAEGRRRLEVGHYLVSDILSHVDGPDGRSVTVRYDSGLELSGPEQNYAHLQIYRDYAQKHGLVIGSASRSSSSSSPSSPRKRASAKRN